MISDTNLYLVWLVFFFIFKKENDLICSSFKSKKTDPVLTNYWTTTVFGVLKKDI